MIQVAAAIIHKNNKILICQRQAKGNCSLLWEFPGGKLESYETLEECLIRECQEELNIKIKLTDIFAKTIYHYPDQEIAFTFFNAEYLEGEITLQVHKDYKWVTTNELKIFEFCPADIEIVKKLLAKKGSPNW